MKVQWKVQRGLPGRLRHLARLTGSVTAGFVTLDFAFCTLNLQSVTLTFRFWMGSLETYRTVLASSMLPQCSSPLLRL